MNNNTGVLEKKYAWSMAFECGVKTHVNYTLGTILETILSIYEAQGAILSFNFEKNEEVFIVTVVFNKDNFNGGDRIVSSDWGLHQEEESFCEIHERGLYIFTATAEGVWEFLHSYHCDTRKFSNYFFDIVEMPASSEALV